MYFNGATVAGSPDVPNEDWFAATPGLLVVLDGATVRTETGCSHGAAWYARKLGAAILANAADETAPLGQVLAESIAEVADLHSDTCNLDHPGTPSAGIAIVRLTGERLSYLVLGDVTVVLDTPGGVEAISDQRISAAAAAERAEVDRHLIGSDEKAEALLVMKHAELAARNREYWVAAADPAAATHAFTGEMPFAAVRRLAVLTDGAARWVDLFHSGEWATVLRMLQTAGPQWFIEKLVRSVEHNDPRGAQHARNKRSDDATAVFAVLQEARPRGPRGTEEARQRSEASIGWRMDDPGLYGERTKAQREAIGR